MSSTTVSRRAHPGLIGTLWGLGILLATAVPAGGLVVSVAAVFTTYRTASRGTKVLLVAVGVLTVLIQFGTLVAFGSSNGTGVPHRVQ